jgi:hypothetical protein
MEPETCDLARDMSTSSSPLNNLGIPSSASSVDTTISPVKEFFINEDYGNIETHLLRKRIFLEPDFTKFNDKNYLISDIICFNLNKNYHFINNQQKACIYFSQLSEQKENNEDKLFLNTILSLLNFNSKSQDTSDVTKIFLETLFNDKFEVQGYRFWCFYFSKALQNEDTLEMKFKDNMYARNQYLKLKTKLVTKETREASKPKKKSLEQKNTLKVKCPHYKYLNFNDNKTIFNVIKDYLYNDPQCTKRGRIINNGFSIENPYNQYRTFTDDLFDTLESKFTNDSQFLKLLSKESAMIYFINGINNKQIDIGQYFNHNKTKARVPTEKLNNLASSNEDSIDAIPEEQEEDTGLIKQNDEDRLNKLRNMNIKNLFKSFPFPNTVYEINPEMLLPEIFHGIPLPHSINSSLDLKSIIGEAEYSNPNDLVVIGLYDSFMVPELQEFYDILNVEEETVELKDIKEKVDKVMQESYLTDSELFYRIRCIRQHGVTIFPLLINKINSYLVKMIQEKSTSTQLFVIKQTNPGFSDPKIVYINNTIMDNLEDYRNNRLAYINEVVDEDDLTSVIDNDSKPDPLEKEDAPDIKTEFFEYCKTKPPVDLKNVKNQSPVSSWWAQILKKYTPNGLDFNNIQELQKYSTSIPVKFLKFDFALRLQILNKVRWSKLKHKYPYRERKESDQYLLYDQEYRILQDAMSAECYYYFFTCDPSLTSEAYIGIRDWILLNYNDFVIADPNWQMNLRPFGQFFTWVTDFLNSFGQIAHNLKVALLLYFCKFHHARYFSISNLKETNKVKLNVILLGDGMSGKSHIFKVIQFTVPANDKCVRDIMHSTAGCNNVDGNYDGYLRLHDEFNSKLWMDNGDHPEGREQLKNILSSHKAETIALEITKGLLDADGNSYTERKQVSYKSSSQMVLICAANNNSALADQNVLTRFLVLRVPKSRKEADEANSNHFKYNISFNDLEYDEIIFKQHQILHAYLVIMEMMIKAGVFEDYNYGVEISGGESALEYILDTVHRTSGINTADHRKRVHQLEIAREMALAYACWMGNVAPFNQYLFYDSNNKYIGFNHRICTMGIMPWAVVTSDQVAVVTQLLNFNYQEAFLENILDIFAFKICKLINTDDNAACFYQNQKDFSTDYSYIYKKVNSLEDMARDIQNHMKYETVDLNGIQAILLGLSKRYKQQYNYRKDSVKDTYLLLEKDKNTKVPITELRPVVKIEKFGQRILVFVSVSFLKETFPSKLNNKFIESDTMDILTNNNNNTTIDDDNNNDSKIIDLDSCFTLSTNVNSNPFAHAFKQYYENKYLGIIDPFFNENDKITYIDSYKIKHNEKIKLPPLRYVTPSTPKDFLLSYDKLPKGSSNIVKLDKVLTVIELDFNNNKDGITEYNLQTYLPSEIYGQRAISFIRLTNGGYKIIKMNENILNNNKTFKREQLCDHDAKPCKSLLKRIHFPGYKSLDINYYINWPLITYHLLMNDFLSIERTIRQTMDNKFLYPEINIEELVKNKKLLLDTEISKLNKANSIKQTENNGEKNKFSILNFASMNKQFIQKPPNEITSHNLLMKKLEEKRNSIKEGQLNLQKQMQIHQNAYTKKTAPPPALKRPRPNSDESPKSPLKKKK